jgi:1-aminocyclopropane-1-carboxylate deaminase
LVPFFQQAHSNPSLTDYARQVKYQPLAWPELKAQHITVYLRRDDLASGYYPGNKFYKLFYHLHAFHQQQKTAMVSFGGAFSNHLHALAALGKQYSIPTVGLIRGQRPKTLSPTLQDACDWGMDLYFLTREAYRHKDLSALQEELLDSYGDYLLIPEGAEGTVGARGCQVLGQTITSDCQQRQWQNPVVCCAVGTGTTLAGIVSGLSDNITCLGFSVLKGQDTLTMSVKETVKQLNSTHANWRLLNDYHCGGYAKVPQYLLEFMLLLEERNHLLLDPVYTAKMLWGIQQLAEKGHFSPGTDIIAVHSGGVQGRRGFGLSTHVRTDRS